MEKTTQAAGHWADTAQAPESTRGDRPTARPDPGPSLTPQGKASDRLRGVRWGLWLRVQAQGRDPAVLRTAKGLGPQAAWALSSLCWTRAAAWVQSCTWTARASGPRATSWWCQGTRWRHFRESVRDPWAGRSSRTKMAVGMFQPSEPVSSAPLPGPGARGLSILGAGSITAGSPSSRRQGPLCQWWSSL